MKPAIKDDIKVRFYEKRNGQEVWVEEGVFTPAEVHKQCAITFRTPPYRTLEVEDPVKVFIQLLQPSDGDTSNSMPFQLTPLTRRIRAIPDYQNFSHILSASTKLLTKGGGSEAKVQNTNNNTQSSTPEYSSNPNWLTDEGAVGGLPPVTTLFTSCMVYNPQSLRNKGAVGGLPPITTLHTPCMVYNPDSRSNTGAVGGLPPTTFSNSMYKLVSPNHPGMVHEENLTASVGVALPSALSPANMNPQQTVQAAVTLENPKETQETLHNRNDIPTNRTSPIHGMTNEPMKVIMFNSGELSDGSEGFSNNVSLNGNEEIIVEEMFFY